jgi:hypothetical protein
MHRGIPDYSLLGVRAALTRLLINLTFIMIQDMNTM